MFEKRKTNPAKNWFWIYPILKVDKPVFYWYGIQITFLWFVCVHIFQHNFYALCFPDPYVDRCHAMYNIHLYMLQKFWGCRVPWQRVYQVLQGLLYFSYVQEANVKKWMHVHQKKTLHDNPSSQTILAHPRRRLQSSPFAIIYLTILLFFSPEKNSQ